MNEDFYEELEKYPILSQKENNQDACEKLLLHF